MGQNLDCQYDMSPFMHEMTSWRPRVKTSFLNNSTIAVSTRGFLPPMELHVDGHQFTHGRLLALRGHSNHDCQYPHCCVKKRLPAALGAAWWRTSVHTWTSSGVQGSQWWGLSIVVSIIAVKRTALLRRACIIVTITTTLSLSLRHG